MINQPPLLTLDGVTKRFGGVVAVREASLQIPRQRITSIIGPNGAGKTTLFNTITAALPATSGTITFQPDPQQPGRAIQNLRPDQIARMGIARTFQNIRLFANLSSLDNVKVGFHHRTKTTAFSQALSLPWARQEEAVVDSSARACLQWCGLGNHIHSEAGSLPYGLQRRLEIARALASAPTLLLLDEPAAGMNPSESKDLLDLIRRITNAGITVLLIEHDMKVVMTISDEIYVLDYGEIIAQGTPDQIRHNPKVIEAYLGHAGATAAAQATVTDRTTPGNPA
jgi:branched-chain amino acid transport system ATP-binding protein